MKLLLELDTTYRWFSEDQLAFFASNISKNLSLFTYFPIKVTKIQILENNDGKTK